MDPRLEHLRSLTRRRFLAAGSLGVGSFALANLIGAEEPEPSAANPLAPRPPHFAPRARRVIYLHMAGAPSQLDLFDFKPELARLNGQPVSEELIRNERFAFIKGVPKVLGSPYRFARHGESGHELSELLPCLAEVADEIALVRSMKTTQFNHAPGQIFLSTGFERAGRPSLGSWLTYGLGSENQDLPGFVVLLSGKFNPDGGAACWSNGFLPSVHQGVRLRFQGAGADAVHFLSDPRGLDAASRRRSLDALAALNRRRLQETLDPEIETRIAQYELAYRMQSSVPELCAIESEPEEVRALYGAEPGRVSFANNCLLARRLCERGVRFVQLYHWGWDSHGTSSDDDIVSSLPERCRETDRACAALLLDLKRRGLLEDTLVVWGGEFGRTPMNEERNGSTFLGRDHHPHAFTIWLAGGGIRAGAALGRTDELGYHVVEDPVTVNDLHATLLYLLGLDHTRLTRRFQGRDFRLTDVAGEVVSPILA